MHRRKESGQAGEKVSPMIAMGELVGVLQAALRRAPYGSAAAALTSEFAKLIATQSQRPVDDARVYGAVLEVLVEEISREFQSRQGGERSAA